MNLWHGTVRTGPCWAPSASPSSTGSSFYAPQSFRVPRCEDAKSFLPSLKEGRPVGVPYAQPLRAAYERELKEKELERLADVFLIADEDKSGTLELDEFLRSANHPICSRILRSLFQLQPHDAPRVFLALDLQGQGRIALKDFINVCRMLLYEIDEGQVVTPKVIREAIVHHTGLPAMTEALKKHLTPAYVGKLGRRQLHAAGAAMIKPTSLSPRF